jgi:hypothetical protein
MTVVDEFVLEEDAITVDVVFISVTTTCLSLYVAESSKRRFGIVRRLLWPADEDDPKGLF